MEFDVLMHWIRTYTSLHVCLFCMPDRVSHNCSACALQVEWILLGHTYARHITSRMAFLILIGVHAGWRVYFIGFQFQCLSTWRLTAFIFWCSWSWAVFTLKLSSSCPNFYSSPKDHSWHSHFISSFLNRSLETCCWFSGFIL